MRKYKKMYSQLSQYQKRILWIWQLVLVVIFGLFIGLTSYFLYSDKKMEDIYWKKYLNENTRLTEIQQKESRAATQVLTGVYVENINEVNIRNSNYTVTFQLWFRWDDDKKLNMMENYEIYNGQIDSQEVMKDIVVDGIRYQLARIKATVAKTFWTTRFPLGSYQLRFYIEPKEAISDIVLIPDKGTSYINENINISGFNVKRFETSRFIKVYKNNRSEPAFNPIISRTVTEYLTSIELNRENVGLYIKCFIALVGTLGWVLIVLFICTYHKVNPLSMIPGALFGTVSNILVGANLVPDALHIGLLEFVNMLGILVIIFVSFSIITINRQRTHYKEEEFASFLGKHIFWLITFFTILGNILLPLSAYTF